ncbi:putative low molecular weight phosphotyrosine protein phosphatase [Phaeomoniella chlamydospora]|uniref:Putative low molecular weight phosphotyrosine protein phosphatase n=1 Tax=Phaeomoniella chlamydospora TaxID=158046 RepID=A0A0G2GD79_PHACM|nr:putative low molecular weight phosphotyrosine protein phosphatase [Phaeomoniella chlamydospora]
MSETTGFKDKINVLFVCLGNICRSPMAHGVFLHHLSSLPPSQRSRFGVIDSCGTGAYHTHEPPDYRTMSVLESHEITGFEHGARKIRTRDFEEFDYILGMDGMNLSDLRRLEQRRGLVEGDTQRAKVSLFGKFGGKQSNGRGRRGADGGQDWDGEEVIDPYYGGDEGFEEVFEQVDRFSKAFIQEVLKDDKTTDVNGADKI